MLDQALIDAIADVAADAGQPKAVAQRLTAWLTRLSETNPGLDENTQFLTSVHSALVIEDSDAD